MKKTKNLLTVLLSVCMILTMFPSVGFADETVTDSLPESEHNYASNIDQSWSYSMEGADNGLYVTFDEQTETESNYDYIYILDGNASELGKYSGTELAGKTVYVPTPGFTIRLTSDRSTEKWGFKVSSVEKVDEYIDLSKVAEVDEIAPVFVGETVNPTVTINGQTLIKDTDYTVTAPTDTVGSSTAVITGTGTYTGTLEVSYQVVDEDNLAEGAAVTESDIALRQSGDTGKSYVNFSNTTSAWLSSIQSMTLTPVESDGVTAVDTGSAAYPNAPAEITLSADQLTASGSRIYFDRTAEDPVVYVMENHDPISITGRWSTNTYPQSQKYLVTVKARGYQDTTGLTTYYTGTAPEFSIIIDEDGDTTTADDRTTAASWTSSEIAEIAEFANGSSQCGMTGFRTFSGEGVSLKALLEKAEVSISDEDYFLLDTSDHYGNYFTYDSLFGTSRYFLSCIYDEEFASFYNSLAESDNESGSIIELRRYLASNVTEEDLIEPRININYTESIISGDDLADAVLPTEDNQDFNSLVAYENQFRFFYGIAMIQEDCQVTFDSQGGSETESQLVKSHLMTSTENTTMRSSYWANSLVIFRGAGENYQTEESTAADRITRPADPSRAGYTFEGWYTDEACTEGNEFDFSSNDGTVDSDITLYAKWSEGSTLPESDHEYTANFDRTWSYDYGEGADNGIIVTFSEDTSTEKNYDYIYIYDDSGNELGKYSGTELAGKSVYVPSSKVLIRLTSDRSSNDYGFKVESIEANGDTIDLSTFGKIGKIDAVEVNGQPEITVTVNNTALTEGTDYTVEYDTSEAGIQTAVVTGTGQYSGTLSKEFMVYSGEIRITDFEIDSAEHNDADAELNQTIIVTVTFDSDIQMTSEDLKDELLITIAGGDVNNTARDVTYEVDGNKLIITMVSTDWVAIYNGVLSISETDNGLLHLTGTEDGEAVIWETQTDNIPIGIVVENEVTEGTESEAASTTVTVTHKANMRGMYHFQLLSLIDGEETVIAQGTSHAHNFYSTITVETIANAISSFVNKQEGYTAVYNEGDNYFTMTADTPVEGQTLAIRMVENKAKIIYAEDAEAAAAVEEAIYAIGTVTRSSGSAIKAARKAYNALTDEQKALVSDDALQTLEDAEAAYAALPSGGGSGGGTPAAPTYLINLPDSAANGSVSSDLKKAEEGDTVTLTVTPADGYETDTVAVKDEKGSEIALTDKGDGTCTFVMPASDVTVEVSFTEKEADPVPVPPDTHDNCPSEPYKDVDTSLWYHEGIDYAIENGLMNGVADDAFAPDETTTRAMIVTILYRLEGEPAAEASTFKDLKAGSWYESAVNWAAANGIVNGYSEDQFAPEDIITREQMAAILYRYAAYKGKDVSAAADLSRFTDSDSISDYAVNAMTWAVGTELINGMTETTLVPQGSATRAQAATLMMRFCENILK